uniref:Exonuclease domain-containing protein n=1 Tax=Timema monikensis TaxID=170555 RepID=A0A7R9E772_9NEOP|nr:unnamed protein product [Timema monikensis]
MIIVSELTIAPSQVYFPHKHNMPRETQQLTNDVHVLKDSYVSKKLLFCVRPQDAQMIEVSRAGVARHMLDQSVKGSVHSTQSHDQVELEQVQSNPAPYLCHRQRCSRSGATLFLYTPKIFWSSSCQSAEIRSVLNHTSTTNITMDVDEHQAKDRLLWIDMEMTGLDVLTCHILEVACLITDAQLNVLAQGPDLIINQPDHILDNMNTWCVEHHGQFPLRRHLAENELRARIVITEVIVRVCCLTALQVLILKNTCHGSVGIAHLASVGIAHLSSVGIACLSSVGMAHLASVGMAHLSSVGIAHLSSVGIAHLSSVGMAHLSSVGIAHLSSVGIARLSSVGIAHLASVGMAHLSSVGMDHLASVGIAHLSSVGIAHLSSVVMDHLSSVGIAHLSSVGIAHLSSSGLSDACRKSKISLQDAEHSLMAFIKTYIPKVKQPPTSGIVAGKCCIAGNSVYMDRLFLQRYMPLVDSHLHYRIVDVSTIKELCRSATSFHYKLYYYIAPVQLEGVSPQGYCTKQHHTFFSKRWNPQIYNQAPKKVLNHRALDDIKESLEELRYYRSAIFIQPDNEPLKVVYR